ncbi:ribosomal RNA small subunit methyltransferase B [Striga asiatica]|uniref:Ribosomal RNA small subunit methyltransferase B n=1 Tax=Striga asiatica TaxID=4170 RepID=A0A5A7R8Y5_STRAF|nr:ribosomal RNA small subunit methyltransferase B [Striga asiatica]
MKKGRDFLKTLHRTLVTLHQKSSIAKMDPSDRYCYNPKLIWNPQVEEYFVKAYGADHFARISSALTQPSCYSCVRVNTLRTTSDAVIEKLSSVLEERGWRCDILGGPYSSEDIVKTDPDAKKCNISKCEIPGLDYVVFLGGSGPHNIDYEYKEDKPPKEVIVSRKCAEAVLRGAHVYVPGVLACSAHVEKGESVAVSVAVEQPSGDGGWGVDPHYFERNGLYIGQGNTMMSRSGMFRASEGVALDMHKRVFNLPSFYDLLEGEIFLQNLPSIITAHALDPQEGERLFDMCAAPGGKTTAIAILMKDKGDIVAADRSHNKVLDIQKRAAEMGLKCITTYKLDALKSVEKIIDPDSQASPQCGENESMKISDLSNKVASVEQLRIENCTSKAELRNDIRKMRNGPGRNNSLGGRVEKCKGFSPNSFDRVLLDAPCSALGLRPRLFAGEDTVESLRTHAKYQKRMFDQAVQLVRPGGVIVYSTFLLIVHMVFPSPPESFLFSLPRFSLDILNSILCTINPGENEALVRYALDTYKFLSLAPQHPKVGGPGLVGGCQFADGYQEEWLRPGEEDLVQRFDPSSELDTIGFFIAKFNVGPKGT